MHLAWAIQPSHDPRALRRTNVTGTERVIAAVAEAGVPQFVVASSVGAYSRPADGHAVERRLPLVSAIPGLRLRAVHSDDVAEAYHRWVMALEVPVMDTSRARAEMGWAPGVSSTYALREILTGMREGAGASTPPLRPAGVPR